MKVQKSFCCLFACLIILTNCIPNSDYSESLSGGYLYRDEGGDTKDILGSGIYGKILDYDYNNNFIVVVQEPKYIEYKMVLDVELDIVKGRDTLSANDFINGENEIDSVLKNDPFYKSIFEHKINYWIISHEAKEVLGPLTKAEYKQKRVELGIPDKLQVSER